MKLYYILSLKHSRTLDGLLTFWRGKASGYTLFLDTAGLYTQAEVDGAPDYFNNGESTRALITTEVHKLAVLVKDYVAGQDGIGVPFDTGCRILGFHPQPRSSVGLVACPPAWSPLPPENLLRLMGRARELSA